MPVVESLSTPAQQPNTSNVFLIVLLLPFYFPLTSKMDSPVGDFGFEGARVFLPLTTK